MSFLEVFKNHQRSHKSKEKASLTMKDVMTHKPVTVKGNHHFITVKRMMAEKCIRHVPVIEAEKVIGILSDRDVMLIQGVYKDRDVDTIRVRDLVLQEAYMVSEECLLKEALETMLDKKYGSVLVEKGGKLTGIFTCIDACRVLLEHIEASFIAV